MKAMAQRRETSGGLETNPTWLAFVADVRARADLQQVMSSQAGVVFPKTSRSSGDKVLCPFHAEKSPSCNVRRNVGLYHCFGCGADGDVFRFLKDYRRIGFVEAVIYAASMFGVPVPEEFGHLAGSKPINVTPFPKSDFRVQQEALPSHKFMMPPADAPIPQPGWLKVWSPLKGREIKLKASRIHVYRSLDRELRGIVARCDMADGTKYFAPLSWADPSVEPGLPAGEPGWIARGYPPGEARAIFGMELFGDIVRNGQVAGIVFIEGEKCVEQAHAFLNRDPTEPQWILLSPQGGQNAIEYMDWADFELGIHLIEDTCPSLVELPVLAWPDADDLKTRNDGTVLDRQALFVNAILARVMEIKTTGLTLAPARVPIPEGRGDGWDIADAISKEGWTREDVLNQLAAATPFQQASSADTDEGVAAPFGILDEAIPEIVPITPDQVVTEVRVENIDHDDVIDGDDGNHHGGHLGVRRGPLDYHCRPLGFDQEFYYFLPRLKGQIVALSYSAMRPQALLTLAPRDVWMEQFRARQERGEEKVNWEKAYDYLMSACHDAGVWSTRNEARVGARMDDGRVFFNSGQELWVEGVGNIAITGMMDEDAVASRYVYTTSANIGAPETVNPFEDGCSEIEDLVKIIKAINWRNENAALYSLSFLGWLAIAPICGALTWRPMGWLDGPRGSGKSWILENIAAKVLGSYAFWVKSNSTESGLRNELNATTLPILFDEAEGEEAADRTRMDQILKLARHATTPGDSMVLQGTSGGGNKRSFSIQTTILFSSITPQLRHSADKSRFAQMSLAGGLDNESFTEKLVEPCEKLFKAKNFRHRFLGRMLKLAGRMEVTKELFVKALTNKSRIERRTADVYGTLLAGAYLLMEGDKEMADWSSADNWLTSQGVKGLISEHGQTISEDKDHDRMMSTLLAYPVMVSTGGGQVRSRVGMLIEIALGAPGHQDNPISQEVAFHALNSMGIRADRGHRPVAGKQYGPGVFFHKDIQPIRDALKDTAYASNYEATLRQIDGAQTTGSINFPGNGKVRAIFIPVEGVLRGFGETDDDAIGSAKN